jgi:hypothetical protein
MANTTIVVVPLGTLEVGTPHGPALFKEQHSAIFKEHRSAIFKEHRSAVYRKHRFTFVNCFGTR